MPLIRYFDMFAGIGGFRAGLDRAGGFLKGPPQSRKTLWGEEEQGSERSFRRQAETELNGLCDDEGHCEIDKYADASYRAIHKIEREECYFPDARKIDPRELPDFDLLCGGFPCQPYSLSGNRRGFEDARGTLFFEIARLAEARRPAYLCLENVFGLLVHDKGETFRRILTTLHDLGYGLEWMVFNSADFGPPQSRRRVFIVGYLDSRCAGKIFPVFGAGGKALVQVLGGPQGSRVYDPRGVACTQTASAGGMGGKTGLYFIDLCAGAPKETEIARCITARYGQTTLSNHKAERSGVKLRDGHIRRLMPRECLRLQGFAEDQIDRLLAIMSDSQAYKQAGNSVTVDVIEAIGRRLREVDEELRREDSA